MADSLEEMNPVDVTVTSHFRMIAGGDLEFWRHQRIEEFKINSVIRLHIGIISASFNTNTVVNRDEICLARRDEIC